MKTPNFLIDQTSPYLLQHAFNPVMWYPWGEKAFEKAKKEDKPVFLSIGYSTCHWCHVMERESFEDKEIAEILNDNFISIKVDREERADIDSIYMSACQAMTGAGGWPLTAPLTGAGKPFFAGTYFPKTAKYGRIGLKELLLNVTEAWKTKRDELENSAKVFTETIKTQKLHHIKNQKGVTDTAFDFLSASFDQEFGGFGTSPKFPAAHNILFLLELYKVSNNKKALLMSEKTLQNMYKGGIFDHIGYGFCRYSTDRKWLVPHFEKMLYDNALLLKAYTKAFDLTQNPIYKTASDKIISYIFREMTDKSGGFYSAQDADSLGEEGKFYTFSPSEIQQVLGKKAAKEFCNTFGITDGGNFEGKNIPNLIDTSSENDVQSEHIKKLYEYRKTRYDLKTDDKILTSWNCLMISALADASTVFDTPAYLAAAIKAFDAINTHLKYGSNLFSSFRLGRHSEHGCLDDYAYYILACISLYKATLCEKYIDLAAETAKKTQEKFAIKGGGFYLSDSDDLIFRPVETYDGAMPCGNSVMCYVLNFLAAFTGEQRFLDISHTQIEFLDAETSSFAGGNSFFALSVLKNENFTKIVCVPKSASEKNQLMHDKRLKDFDIVRILGEKSADYPLKNDKTTFYICKGKECLPPQNQLP